MVNRTQASRLYIFSKIYIVIQSQNPAAVHRCVFGVSIDCSSATSFPFVLNSVMDVRSLIWAGSSWQVLQPYVTCSRNTHIKLTQIAALYVVISRHTRPLAHLSVFQAPLAASHSVLEGVIQRAESRSCAEIANNTYAHENQSRTQWYYFRHKLRIDQPELQSDCSIKDNWTG